MNEATQLAETVPQFRLRSTVYLELAKRFQKFGEMEMVKEIIKENLEIIVQIRDHSARAVSLSELSEFYVQNEFKTGEEEREILKKIVRESIHNSGIANTTVCSNLNCFNDHRYFRIFFTFQKKNARHHQNK